MRLKLKYVQYNLQNKNAENNSVTELINMRFDVVGQDRYYMPLSQDSFPHLRGPLAEM